MGAARRPSVNFRQHFIQTKELLSTFCVAGRPSVNFLYDPDTYRKLLSTFCEVGRASVNFCQLSALPGELPWTSVNICVAIRPSVNILCAPETYRLLRLPSLRPGDIPWTFFNFACGRETLRKFPSSFRAAERFAVDLSQLSLQLDDILVAATPSMQPRDFVIRRHSFNFRQISMRQVDLLSTSVNFPCRWETFRQLLLTFHTAERLAVNFRQLPMRPGNFSSPFRASRRPRNLP